MPCTHFSIAGTVSRGIVMLSLAELCLTSFVIYRSACLHARPAVAFAVTCLAMAVNNVHWLVRPHVFSWLFLALLLSGCGGQFHCPPSRQCIRRGFLRQPN